ncbi:MAG TPA: TIGR00730 family Rossman fold protein [Vicinamibacteria bacterium]|nr:TIGR00730 family Rossman fold protein [Vicinamibacteria bacterium]
MRQLRAVTVFCGSSAGRDPAYAAAAERLGRALADTGRTLVYGGGHVGLMGRLADAALETGGHVVGVIPQSLMAREVGHRGLPDLRVVATMHERKALMAKLGDAFVALPGGFGTLDELFEAVTWAQLGLHGKPIGLLNVGGYFDSLLRFADRSTADGFVRPEHRALLVVETDPLALLEALAAFELRPASKWL